MKILRPFSASALFPTYIIGVALGAAVCGFLYRAPALAQSASAGASSVSAEVDRLQKEISERNSRLADIEKEITSYRAQLQKVGGEKATLQSAIRKLELEQKKVQSDLSYTQNKIGATDLEIQKLTLEMQNTESDIAGNQAAIEEIIRRLNEADHTPLIELLLTNERLSEVWTALDELSQVRDALGKKIRDLVVLQRLLAEKTGEQRAKRGDLVTLKHQYTGQQKVLEVNKAEKNNLLAETKNEEAGYQKLLKEQKAAKAQFEQELRELEARLQFVLDPTSIPEGGTAVFRWPLDSVRITQYFGNTEFSRSAAYNGQGHNGIDLGAPIGTIVRAALSGTVIAVNTQVAPMCQYGKWALIRHQNGLTTLYAHLSVVSVNKGDEVATGAIVGYSGNTGYAIGPHLHFTVYASEAVQFTQYTCKSGITLTIPVAAYTGYLNPMLYLPPL